jgi:hypothetical protein
MPYHVKIAQRWRAAWGTAAIMVLALASIVFLVLQT